MNGQGFFVEDPNGGGYKFVITQPQHGFHQPPPFGGRKAMPPPPENPEEQAAYLEYMKVITEQEKQEVLRMQIVNRQEQLRADQQIGNLYMQGLGEIRTALSGGKLRDGETNTIGDQRPLDRMFNDDIDDGKLRQRYLAMLDKYLDVMKVQIPKE